MRVATCPPRTSSPVNDPWRSNALICHHAGARRRYCRHPARFRVGGITEWSTRGQLSNQTGRSPVVVGAGPHTYTRSTDDGAGVSLRVDVTYTARYRVDGGGWQTIPDVLTIPGTPRALPVKQATAVLVSDD